jgi:hypothetical protein
LVTTRLLKNRMIGVQRSANGQAFVAGRGLDVGAAKGRAIEQLAVGDAVEGAASGHGKIVAWKLLIQVVQEMKENLLETMLQRKGNIHIALSDFGVWSARLAEKLLHAMGKMAGEADGAIGQNLHAGIAAQRLEVAEI